MDSRQQPRSFPKRKHSVTAQLLHPHNHRPLLLAALLIAVAQALVGFGLGCRLVDQRLHHVQGAL